MVVMQQRESPLHCALLTFSALSEMRMYADDEVYDWMACACTVTMKTISPNIQMVETGANRPDRDI
jgi:hypothetical protein